MGTKLRSTVVTRDIILSRGNTKNLQKEFKKLKEKLKKIKKT